MKHYSLEKWSCNHEIPAFAGIIKSEKYRTEYLNPA